VTETVRTDPTARPPDANGGTPSPAPAHASRSARTVRATASRWFQRPARTWPGRVSIIAGSAAIALGVSDAINRRFLAPGGMQVTTDVVGFPTLRNFDSVHYTELFALAAVVFPVIMLVSFVVLDRIVPRVFARIGNERVVNGAGVAGRLAIPGAALGLAVAAAGLQTGGAAVMATMVLGAVAWAVVVGAAAFVLDRLRPGESYAFRLAEANALAVPATLLGLAAVSTATGVEVLDTDTVEYHPFLPWWLAVVGVALVVGLVAWRLRSAGPGIEDRRAFERDTVALVAGSVIVFLITAKLPGAFAQMDVFHEGEFLATATMLRDGLFPWRDLLFIHGPLHDGLVTMLGFAVFGDTRWGGFAGVGVLATPLAFVFAWILLARVLRANWAVLAGYPLLLAAGWEFFDGLVLSSVSLRMAFLPLVALLAIRALRSSAVGWSVALGAVLFVAFVLTPEFIFPLVALAVAVVGFEWVDGRGLRWRRRFSRTLAAAAGGVGAAGVFALWLLANGALDDFVFYFRTFAPDHELTGAFPIDVGVNGFKYLVAGVLPWVLAVVTGMYFAWRLATRRALRAADWVIGSLAIAGLIYYPKFLARADGHVYGQMVFALPLLIYALARGLEPGDRDLEQSAPGRAPRHALSVVVVGALLVTAVEPALRALGDISEQFRPEVATAAPEGRLGYQVDALPAGMIDDMRTVIDAVGPDARVFDLSNQPATLYYLLGLPSPTRYVHVSMAIREPNQTDLIEELEAEPPELVLYWSDTMGLPHWDGIINPVRHYDVSQYVLENYRPWVAVHGQTFYLRNDIDPPDVASFAGDLSVEPATYLRGDLPPCDWGTAPMYLDSAPQVGTDGETLVTELVVALAQFTGWAAPVDGVVPHRVLAVTGDGRVVSEARADQPRPDLAPTDPESVNSGFTLTAPLVAGELADDVHVMAVTEGGAVAAVGDGAPLAAGTALRWSGGTAVVGSGAGGSIDGSGITAPPADERILRVDLPPGSTETYDWLEVDLAGEPAEVAFTLTDTYGSNELDVSARPIGQGIHFETLARDIDRFLVQGASCAQWREFGGDTLYLRYGVPNDVTLTLQRSVVPPGSG
jgi:hypothetical protein